MNSIQWKPKAVKQLLKLDRRAQVQIRDDVGAKLAQHPFGSSVKALADHAFGYRLRVGNYRVLFDFDGVAPQQGGQGATAGAAALSKCAVDLCRAHAGAASGLQHGQGGLDGTGAHAQARPAT